MWEKFTKYWAEKTSQEKAEIGKRKIRRNEKLMETCEIIVRQHLDLEATFKSFQTSSYF